jgi:integrase
MLETGCRPGELRTLQWADVHDDHFVVIAAKAKDKEDRSIPILDTLRTILDRRAIGPDGAKLGPDAYVFGNETGDIVNARHLCTMWQATCKAAGVTDLHLHDLRREFASQLSDSNVPVAQVRDALGHSNITMTSRYLGISREGVRSAYDKLAAARAARRSAD